MSCVASYLLWNEETKAPVQVPHYQQHLWIIWWSQPLDFIAERSKGWRLQMSADLPGCAWKSASTGTSHVLMQISLQPSSGFNPSRERHMKSSSQAGMKRTWKKQESVSKPATAVFNGAQLWKKKAKSGLSLEILPAASAQVSRRSWDPGTKETRVWYGEQLHQTRTIFDSLLGVQPHLISRVYML